MIADEAKTKAGRRAELLRRLTRRFGAWLGPYVSLVLICAVFSVYPSSRESFLTWENWRLIAAQSVIVGTAALGMTLVMIAGGIDLSVGSAVALVTVAVVQAQRQIGLDLPMALAFGVLIGGACGLVNGLLVAGLRVVPFIVTLGMMRVYRGLAKWWAGNLSIYAFDRGHPEPSWLRRMLSANLEQPGWLPAKGTDPLSVIIRELSRLAPGFWVLLGLSAITAVLLRRSLLGRYLYAVGSNEATARLCGIRIGMVNLSVYVLAGLAVGLAGVMQFAYSHGTGEPTAAEGLELRVIAAVVIGGGSLRGGEGTVLGTLLGCLVISVLDNGCTLALLPNAFQDILIGAIIIVAVTFDQLRRDPRAIRDALRRLLRREG